MIKVTIIVPVYNVEIYLNKCLNSVVNQTLKDIEIIIINDGSTDNSLSICKEYAKNDDRIILIDQLNGGYGKAVNVGIEAAKGEYIGIVEPDDFIELNMYETLYDKTEIKKFNIIRAQYYHYYSSNAINKTSFINSIINQDEEIRPFEWNKQDIFYHPSSIWSAIYNKDFLNKNNIRLVETKGAGFQDLPFYIETLFAAESIYLVLDYLYYYRQTNPNSSINLKSINKCYLIFNLYSLLVERLKCAYAEKYSKYTYIINNIFVLSINWNISGKITKQYILKLAKITQNFVKTHNLNKHITVYNGNFRTSVCHSATEERYSIVVLLEQNFNKFLIKFVLWPFISKNSKYLIASSLTNLKDLVCIPIKLIFSLITLVKP